MNMNEYVKKLIALGACIEGLKWFRQQESPQAAWQNFERPNWMLWLIGKTRYERKRMTWVACQFARLALPHATSPAVLACIETTEAWVDGKATVEQVREARRRCYAAAYAYAAAAYAYAAAAYAAYAAYATAYATAAAAATKKKVQLECCGIIRSIWPEVPTI